MLTLTLHELELQLPHAFGISRGAISVQPTLIVELSDGVHSGYGQHQLWRHSRQQPRHGV